MDAKLWSVYSDSKKIGNIWKAEKGYFNLSDLEQYSVDDHNYALSIYSESSSSMDFW